MHSKPTDGTSSTSANPCAATLVDPHMRSHEITLITGETIVKTTAVTVDVVAGVPSYLHSECDCRDHELWVPDGLTGFDLVWFVFERVTAHEAVCTL